MRRIAEQIFTPLASVGRMRWQEQYLQLHCHFALLSSARLTACPPVYLSAYMSGWRPNVCRGLSALVEHSKGHSTRPLPVPVGPRGEYLPWRWPNVVPLCGQFGRELLETDDQIRLAA